MAPVYSRNHRSHVLMFRTALFFVFAISRLGDVTYRWGSTSRWSISSVPAGRSSASLMNLNFCIHSWILWIGGRPSPTYTFCCLSCTCCGDNRLTIRLDSTHGGSTDVRVCMLSPSLGSCCQTLSTGADGTTPIAIDAPSNTRGITAMSMLNINIKNFYVSIYTLTQYRVCVLAKPFQQLL